MNPDLVFKFHQKFRDLHIHSSMGVDENNIAKIDDIVEDLLGISRQLYLEVYPEPAKTPDYINRMQLSEDVIAEPAKLNKKFSGPIKPENDVVEATAELRTRVKPHRPEAK